MKPKFITTKFRKHSTGASLVTAVTICLSGSAFGTVWSGGTSTDWNNNANWAGGTGTGGSNAIISTTPANIATISANIVATPVDILVGDGTGASGRLIQNAGGANTGNGNWMIVGRGTGTGVFDLANTATTGGTLTGYGLGSGTMTVGNSSTGGRLYVGDGGTGTVNVNTSGSLIMRNDLDVGVGTNGVGVVNVDAGTVTTGGWNFVGNGNGSVGTFNQSGGNFTNTGRTYVGGRDAGGTNSGIGHYNISGGTNTNNDRFSVGSGNLTATAPSTISVSGGTLNTPNTSIGGAAFDSGDSNPGKGTASVSGTGIFNVNGELWVGENVGSTGSITVSGGAINVNNWLAIGRHGTGTVTQTGGVITKTGGGSVTISNFDSAVGKLEVSGGLFDVRSGDLIVGEGGAGTGELLFSGGQINAPRVLVATGGTVVSTVSFNGGTLSAGKIDGSGGGTSNVSFNGTTITATGVQPSFITGIDSATLGAGNLKVNSNGFAIGSNQIFTGTGGVVKTGTGTFSLTGANTYTGLASVQAGKLDISTDSTGGGSITVSDGASLGVTAVSYDAQLSPANVTLGATGSTSVSINYSGIYSNPSLAPLNVNALAINGTVTLNLANALPSVGAFPLVKYATKTGGNFVLGSLPPGVIATLVNDTTNKLYYLNITSVALPRWNGSNVSSVWDVNTTQNWVDTLTLNDSKFQNGNPVLFDDSLTSDPPATNVTLGVAVLPGGVTFNNSVYNYTLAPTAPAGKISGTGGLTKMGSGGLAISTVNDYTGVTTLSGGVTTVATLTNGGVASPLGAASASASNLVFSGGTLNYTGPAATIDRGYLLGGTDDTVMSTLSIANNLTITGQVDATFGKITKTGAGTLTLTNPGHNVLGNSNAAPPGSFVVQEGAVVLSGGGTQTNTVTGELRVGTSLTTGQSLTLINTSLTANTWVGAGAGNGTTGLVSSITATGSTITSGGFSLGYDNGVTGYLATSNATFTNSSLTTGIMNLGESTGATSNFTMNSSTLVGGQMNIGINTGSTGTVIFDGASTASSTELNIAKNGGSTGTMIVKGTSVFNTNNRVLLGVLAGDTGNLSIEGNGVFNRTAGYTSIAVNGTGTLTVKNNGTMTNAGSDFNITDLPSSIATFNLQDSGTVTAGTTYFGKGASSVATVNISGGTYTGSGNTYVGSAATSTGTVTQTGGTVNIGNDGGENFIGSHGVGIWNQSAGTVSTRGWTIIGRYPDAGCTGTLNVTGGTFNQLTTNRNILVGEENVGVLNISGTGIVNAVGDPGVVVGNSAATGNGTINLNTGGTLITRSIQEGSGGTSVVNFNGGTLRAQAAGVNAVFMQNLDSAVIKTSGVTIDSNGNTLAVNQILSDDGSTGLLTKTGAGSLLLNGVNTYHGNTQVTAGSLGGTGTLPGAVSVGAGANINPGATAGTLTVGSVTFAAASSLNIDIAPAPDTLAVTGNLNLTNAALVLNGVPTDSVYVIASYGTLTGTFASVPTLPAGYSIDYAYLGNQIALKRAASAYDTWIGSYFPGVTDPAIIGTTADPDGDGSSNALEFALGGVPNSGANGPKIYSIIADGSVDVDTNKELLLTIAVRSGAPVFAGSPSPTALKDGYNYTVQGSVDLVAFTSAVTVVAPVTTGLPAVPAGYEYRTFSLDGSNNLPTKGFLRVKINP